MEEKPKKWLPYFDSRDTLKPPGCLPCNQIKELSWRNLGNLYCERELDGRTRVGLIKAKGPCNWRAWMNTEVSVTK